MREPGRKTELNNGGSTAIAMLPFPNRYRSSFRRRIPKFATTVAFEAGIVRVVLAAVILLTDAPVQSMNFSPEGGEFASIVATVPAA